MSGANEWMRSLLSKGGMATIFTIFERFSYEHRNHITCNQFNNNPLTMELNTQLFACCSVYDFMICPNNICTIYDVPTLSARACIRHMHNSFQEMPASDPLLFLLSSRFRNVNTVSRFLCCISLPVFYTVHKASCHSCSANAKCMQARGRFGSKHITTCECHRYVDISVLCRMHLICYATCHCNVYVYSRVPTSSVDGTLPILVYCVLCSRCVCSCSSSLVKMDALQ